MISILDIDLDYFNLADNPAQKLQKLLRWADCPISFIVEDHHDALPLWANWLSKKRSNKLKYLLHVDEHHDMMDEKPNSNIANFVYHAMKKWEDVRVHWMVTTRIDSPKLWLSNDAWKSVSHRFSMGSNRPHNWPKPQIVSICTSPEFISPTLYKELMCTIKQFSIMKPIGKTNDCRKK